MNHSEIREAANKELKSKRFGSLSVSGEEKITEGLSSGSMVLNSALSGYPFVGYVWGRMVEIYGPESAGKTTLALHAILEAQKLEKQTGVIMPVYFADAEHALDPRYVKSMGINGDDWGFSQSECAEDVLEEIETALHVGYKLLVVDSVAGLTPRAELKGEVGESHMGLQARLMSQAMRRLSGLCSRQQALIIWVNQLRDKIGVLFWNPETTPGGRALKFYCSYRIEVRAPRGGAKKKSLMGFGEGEKQSVETGTIVNAHVRKNKLYPPHRTASYYLEYGKGIDRRKDAVTWLEYAKAFKKTKKSKGPVLRIPSKGKAYSPSRLLSLLGDINVQKDVIGMIKEIGHVDYS